MKVTRKELSKWINYQNNLIEKAKANGCHLCKITEKLPNNDIKDELIYYYSEMIGYGVKDDVIDFKHINFFDDNNLFTEFIIKQDGTKDKTMFY